MKNSHLDRRSKYSQQMIRLAFFQLLEEKDLPTVTVTDICRIADINRGTFYKYYHDVNDLFHQIEKAFTDNLHQLFQETESQNFDMERFLLNTLYMISDNRDFVHVVQKGNTTSRMVEDIFSVVKPYSLQIIQKTYPEMADCEKEYLLEYRLGGIISMIVKWVDDDMVIPIEQMHKMVIDVVSDSPALWHF